jgi:hypothetical protein
MWMEMIFAVLVVVIVYIAALHTVVKYTVDKLGARSALFGAGLVHFVLGGLLYAVIGEIGFAVGYDYWYDRPSIAYYVVRGLFLAMKLSGVVMVAVDLLKAVASQQETIVDVKKHQADRNENDTSFMPQSGAKKTVPTWKRIQMEQDTQGDDQ